MTIDDALTEYETGYQLCKALGIKQQNFSQWQKRGYLPELQQWRLMFISGGKLMIDSQYLEKLSANIRKQG